MRPAMARRTNDQKAVLSRNLPTMAKGFSPCRTEQPHLRPCRVRIYHSLSSSKLRARRTWKSKIFRNVQYAPRRPLRLRSRDEVESSGRGPQLHAGTTGADEFPLGVPFHEADQLEPAAIRRHHRPKL